MKQLLIAVILASAVGVQGFGDLSFWGMKPETRCGWFQNPTPANAWLIDASGEWIIATQGGQQADGEWPTFKRNQWVRTNGNYGYGCACVKAETDRSEKRITNIISATAKPLSSCRADKALKGKEPR